MDSLKSYTDETGLPLLETEEEIKPETIMSDNAELIYKLGGQSVKAPFLTALTAGMFAKGIKDERYMLAIGLASIKKRSEIYEKIPNEKTRKDLENTMLAYRASSEFDFEREELLRDDGSPALTNLYTNTEIFSKN